MMPGSLSPLSPWCYNEGRLDVSLLGNTNTDIIAILFRQGDTELGGRQITSSPASFSTFCICFIHNYNTTTILTTGHQLEQELTLWENIRSLNMKSFKFSSEKYTNLKCKIRWVYYCIEEILPNCFQYYYFLLNIPCIAIWQASLFIDYFSLALVLPMLSVSCYVLICIISVVCWL